MSQGHSTPPRSLCCLFSTFLVSQPRVQSPRRHRNQDLGSSSPRKLHSWCFRELADVDQCTLLDVTQRTLETLLQGPINMQRPQMHFPPMTSLRTPSLWFVGRSGKPLVMNGCGKPSTSLCLDFPRIWHEVQHGVATRASTSARALTVRGWFGWTWERLRPELMCTPLQSSNYILVLLFQIWTSVVEDRVPLC